MNQLKSMTNVNKANNVKNIKEDQFQYLGRWVDKKGFRAFVYDKNGHETLADSYDQFESLIGSGIWFASKADASPKRKQKDDVTLSTSK